MSDLELLVDSVLAFLRSADAAAAVGADRSEELGVAAQCLQAAFARPDLAALPRPPPDLLALFRRHAPAPAPAPAAATTPTAVFTTEAMAAATAALAEELPVVPPEIKARAEALKNEGNTLMKAEKFTEALAKYTEAISLDASNAIFYCNRAAAHSSLKNHEATIDDCRKALELNPTYGRAFGRLGLAMTNLNRHEEARESYRIACRLEPQNEAYRNNLAVTEETLRQNPPAGGFPGGVNVGVDLGSLLQNQTLANVASQMLSDPALQNFMGRLLGDLGGGQNAETGGISGGGLNVLLQAGQQLAQQMQQANPELVEQLRQQMNQQPAPQPPPKPPQ